ncbi:Uncharacterised protein [Mycoplasmopsis edwardii]|uniref:Uncharacterized protein n=1 Tax=Mycoplasmopsis edwardii TaxID=53558 RepID=A0A3B0PMX1_9BACT|nr:Uncharacterised protein [Mycoplasmopsis edwardii]
MIKAIQKYPFSIPVIHPRTPSLIQGIPTKKIIKNAVEILANETYFFQNINPKKNTAAIGKRVMLIDINKPIEVATPLPPLNL